MSTGTGQWTPHGIVDDRIASTLDNLRDVTDWLARYAPDLPPVPIGTDTDRVLVVRPYNWYTACECVFWLTRDAGLGNMTLTDDLLDAVRYGDKPGWQDDAYEVRTFAGVHHVIRKWGRFEIVVVILEEMMP